MKRKDRNTQSPSPAERLPSLDRSSRVPSYNSQNMLQNITPPQILLNTETDHSITSHRGVIAPLEVIRHLNSVQALNAHACAVQTTNSFTTQQHDGTRTLRINSWRNNSGTDCSLPPPPFLGVAYECLVLPFGLSLSPQVFVKCTEAALTPLREKDIRLTTYIDD